MSIQAAQAFVKEVEGNEELQKQISAASSDNLEESLAKVVAIGSSTGFEFRAQDLREVTSQLSDGQLEEAAGGLSWLRSDGAERTDGIQDNLSDDLRDTLDKYVAKPTT